ncbi:hypothetical protein SAY87_003190 [Trapa incisa]|uniref:Arf-GAP domain-containing protein n=1 Tax=Trapa incisa TaxID=236973 RepID=A0AAN7QHP5_9MYRT|nr:hypothetical protein SAY87_003190 [Trapa incisa]
MNEKTCVSKELNAKHKKILEGLLKLPENRECADCKTKGPRWASVNLVIFICMQCSGIHRSLGVHISKVRSATLDTWLPEQVAYIQCTIRRDGYLGMEIPGQLLEHGNKQRSFINLTLNKELDKNILAILGLVDRGKRLKMAILVGDWPEKSQPQIER